MRKNNTINIYIWCFLVLMSTLTIPIKLYFSSGWIIQGLTIILIVLFLINNKLNKHILIFFGCISIIFFCDALFFQFPKETIEIYIEMIKFGFLFYWFSTEVCDIDELFKVYYYFGIIGILVILVTILKDSSAMSYMGVGTQLIYCIIPIIYTLYTKVRFKILNSVILIFSTIVCAIYANRMSLVTLFLIILFSDVYFIREGSIVKKVIKYFTLSGVFLYLSTSLLGIVEEVLILMKNYGYMSYSLYKLQYMLAGGEDITKITSGRDIIYEYALQMIKSSGFFPNGIGFFKATTSYEYPHNVFLDLAISFGFFIIPILLLYLFYLLQTLKMRMYRYNYIILVFFIFSLSRLIVSSTIWADSAFWISLGFAFRKRQEFRFIKVNNKKEVKGSVTHAKLFSDNSTL